MAGGGKVVRVEGGGARCEKISTKKTNWIIILIIKVKITMICGLVVNKM